MLTSATSQDRWAVLGVLGAVLAGVALRAAHAGAAISSDEVAILQPVAQWGVAAIVDNPESAMNPPLHRLLIGLAGGEFTIAEVGRRLSQVASIAAIGVMGWAGWRWTEGRAWGAVMAAWIVAVEPMFAVESSMVRVYPLVVLTLAVRLAAWTGWLSRPSGGPGAVWVAATALLPWWHHATVPLLGLEAVLVMAIVPGGRRLARGYGVAAVAALPSLGLVWRWRDHLVGADGGSLSPWTVAAVGHEALVPVVGVLIGGGALAAARGGPRARVAWASATAAVATVLLVGMVSRARLPVGLLALPSLALWIAVWPTVLGERARIAWIGMAVALGLFAPRSVRDDLRPVAYPPSPAEAIQAVARSWHDDPRPITVAPFHQVWVWRHQLRAEGMAVQTLDDGAGLTVEGVPIHAVRQGPLPSGTLWFACEPPPSRCRLGPSLGTCAAVLVCDDG